jgi:galactonate dehydratase
MEITGVETARLGGSSAVVKLETDAGVDGFGEAVVETVPTAVLDVVERFGEEYLIGRDPAPIEKHRRVLQDAVWYHDGAVVNSALTGIEHALWDIKGKDLEVPVYELLGGPVRDSVRVYKWIGAESREDLAAQAEARVEEGLTAVKFSPTPEPEPSPYPRCIEEVREIVEAVREAVGHEVDIMLDPASRWKLAEARHILSELEEFHPLFAEDFVSSSKHIVPNEIEKVADSTSIPYALGAQTYRVAGFEKIIHRDAAAVLQPDIGHAGGILEIKKIAAAAEHHGIRIAPHNPLGPVATAAAVHVDLAVPNFLIQEIAGTDFFGAWGMDEYVDAPALNIVDGHIPAPDAPGLGVSIADELFEERPEVPDPPLFFGDDFHVPEW